MAHDGLDRRGFLRLGGIAAVLAAAPRVGRAQGSPVAGKPIGIIGAGREGGALGTLCAKAGHKVMFATRHPDELKPLLERAGPNAQAGSVDQAIAFGDIIFLVVPYAAIAQIGQDHAAALAKKSLVIDVSNPIARRDGDAVVKAVAAEGGPGYATAKALPGAPLVRGFNAIGSARLAERAAHPPTLGVPIAGDDAAALTLASALIEELGFAPVVVGGLAMGRFLVPGTELAGEHTPEQIKQIVAGLH